MSLGPGSHGDMSVYRIYGADDRLLYVGCGLDARERVLAHRRPKSSLFAHLIVRWEIDEPQNIFLADAEEARQIAELAPAYNVIGNVECGWPKTLRRKSQLPVAPLLALSRGGGGHAR